MENKKEIKKDNNFETLFKEIYNLLNYYIDDKEENILIYTLWIIGIHFHDEFITYPYLFLNAIKGSGKSRLLRLISILGNGILTTGITESGLYRTKGLMCLDETESLHSREKQTLREILNTAYKKDNSVIRMKKVSFKGCETFEPEVLQTYRPIAMANIWGMESILGDRCITCIIEKSNKNQTVLIEDYKNDSKIKNILLLTEEIKKEKKFSFDENFFQVWNYYVTNFEQRKKCKYHNIFSKILDTNINGRSLELFFPLLLIALKINDKIFDLTLEILSNKTKEKIEKDFYDSIDIRVYQFIASKQEGYYLLRELCKQFKDGYEYADDWITPKWFSNELTKLGLIKNKRISTGNLTQIYINPLKASNKLLMFKVK